MNKVVNHYAISISSKKAVWLFITTEFGAIMHLHEIEWLKYKSVIL